MNAQPPILIAEGLRKTFGDRVAVSGLDLEVWPGEVFGFLGPNGAGKTTSISMLTGFLPPDDGQVHIAGTDLMNKPREAKRLLGVVPQEIAVYPTLSARSNLTFFGKTLGIPRQELKDAIGWALKSVGLEDRADDRVSAFSGGMQRRLNIACGIIHKPRVLFLDEPTVGVDAQSRERIFETVEQLSTELNMAVLYTSHYMPEVERLCDRIAIIDTGDVIATGTIDELLSNMSEGRILWDIRPEHRHPDSWSIREIAEWLLRVGRVEVIDHGEGVYTIIVAGEETATALQSVARISKHANVDLDGLHFETASLENLFLTKTGRAIRDEAG